MFIPPVGYLNAPKWTGKSLMPDPDRAALVTRAFEEFATGRFTKEEVLDSITRSGFRTRAGSTMNPQSFGRMLTNRLYTGFIDMPHFAVSRRGDFDPLVSDETFYRVQAILQGRIQVVGPHLRSRPDFPLKGLVRCADCGRPLTASWSKGRSGRYAYYHCWRQCRAVNVTKAKLEGAFSDELERLQPTPGYMRLVKDLVLRAWRERKVEVGRDAADAERSAKAIQQKLDRLDEAFIYAKAIDLDTYERQRDRLRQELTLTQIDKHSVELEKFDVEGILAFAERVLPRAADLWVQASLNQKQRLQQLFFPDGIAFDGKRFVRTAVTEHAFNYLTCADGSENQVASLGVVGTGLAGHALARACSSDAAPAGTLRSTRVVRREPRHYCGPLGFPLRRARFRRWLIRAALPRRGPRRRASRVPFLSVSACCAPYPAELPCAYVSGLERNEHRLRRDMTGSTLGL